VSHLHPRGGGRGATAASGEGGGSAPYSHPSYWIHRHPLGSPRPPTQGSSERNISLVIPKDAERKALNCLHTAFFGMKTRTIYIFLIGPSPGPRAGHKGGRGPSACVLGGWPSARF